MSFGRLESNICLSNSSGAVTALPTEVTALEGEVTALAPGVTALAPKGRALSSEVAEAWA